MTKRIPSPGKKWAYKEIGKIVKALRAPLIKMSNRQLKAVVATIDQFSSTNCGWDKYWAKDTIRTFAVDQLNDNIKFKKRKPK